MIRNAKILIIDDSQWVLQTMMLMLLYLGVEDVGIAASSRHALNLFDGALQRGTPYSLVFLETLMPDLNGRETLNMIRALEKDAGIPKDEKATIIITGSLNSPSDIANCMIGCDWSGYLAKPFNIIDLQALLNTHGFLIPLSADFDPAIM